MYYSRSQCSVAWCAVFIRKLASGPSSALMGLEGEGMRTAPVFGLRVSSTNVDDSNSWSLTGSFLKCEGQTRDSESYQSYDDLQAALKKVI
jgi:hypothetical protein